MIKKILIGYAPKNHVILAFDEINGLKDLGYTCKPIIYGRNNQSISKINKFFGVIINALNIVFTLYKFSPDIIYLNSRFEPVASTRDFISILIIKFLYYKTLKIAIKTHGSDLEFLKQKSFFITKIILPYLIRNVDLWFFLSKEEKDAIQVYNKKMGEKAITTSNIIDTKRSVSFAGFRTQYNIESNKFLFLYAGRIVKEKGVFTIMQSIQGLYFKDNCIFCFVGDGPHLTELKLLSQRLQLNKYVHFTGFIPETECDHFYANADALIFPTYYTEGFPMALFKSIAAGLPIITTKIRAAKDHLIAPDNVLWVNGQSVDSVRAAIKEIYENSILRASMSHNNKMLGKSFSAKNVCRQMSDAFISINNSLTKT